MSLYCKLFPVPYRGYEYGLRAYAHEVMTAVLVFHNNETAAMLLHQTNPVGVQLFSYVNTLFCSNKFACPLDTLVHVPSGSMEARLLIGE